MGEQPEQDRIRLILLDDHGLFRASLARFLGSLPGMEVVGECGTSAEALEALNGSTVNLVLLDFDLGSERGNEFISAAREAGYRGKFLIVAGAADPKSVAIALKRGASGIFLKSEAPERLVRAIQSIANGEVWIDPKVVQLLAERLAEPYLQFDEGSTDLLDDRERKVLLGILSGLTNRRIGENLGLSESSVKNVVQRLFDKSGVKTRGQLVRAALEGSLGATRKLINRHVGDPNEKLKYSQLRRRAPSLPSPAGRSHR
jgi:two-component system nitrate/nitrite response regulator NarL